MPGEHTPSQNVQVRRSRRRRRTVAAYVDGDTVIVLIPARFSAVEEREWVQKMLVRLAARQGGSRRHRGDAELLARATELARLHLDGSVVPVSVRWVTNQNARWGSCTPADRSIRLSTRLRAMPGWVVDYVLVHELVHLRVPGHGPDFWALVNRYPRAQRARGYLEGVAAAAGLGPLDDDAEPATENTGSDPAADAR